MPMASDAKRLADRELEHVATICAQGDPETDLVLPPAHRIRHDAVDADRGQDEGDGAENSHHGRRVLGPGGTRLREKAAGKTPRITPAATQVLANGLLGILRRPDQAPVPFFGWRNPGRH